MKTVDQQREFELDLMAKQAELDHTSGDARKELIEEINAKERKVLGLE